MYKVVQDILDVFDRDDIEEYPRATIDQALEHEKELTPHLIKILENVLRDPAAILSRERFFGHIFALNLLAHFRNLEAHETVVNLMSLPGDVVSDLFGDMVTEDFPRILYQTCGGEYERIKGLILNKEAYEYVRGSAMKAIVFGVLLGDLPRSRALDFFGGLFTGNEAENSSYFWDGAASCVCDLYPEELLDTIKDAYNRGLIWPGYIGIESFDSALSENRDDFLTKKRKRIESSIREDFHSYMSWWACFDKDVSASLGKGVDNKNHRPSSKGSNKKRKKKTRKRISKASRKKNRRR